MVTCTAAVRQRLVGQGEIPPVFSLCSVGRDFRTAVLTLDAPSAPTPLAKGALTTEQSTMEVRRMTEDVGSSARGYVGGLSDWCVCISSIVPGVSGG